MFAMMMAGSMSAQGTKIDPWPWDFPQGIRIVAEPGQYVLSCDGMYFAAIKENKDLTSKTLIWYYSKMKKVGAEKSVFEGDDREVPNALIIPLQIGQKAKKGDVLLTWWQHGSGLMRAKVIDASNPMEPVAVYIDRYWDDKPESERNAEKAKGEQLKPNTFTVLKPNDWQPGATVAYNEGGTWKHGIVMNIDGDKVLVCCWADHLIATTKDKCKIIPFNEKIKKGDKVYISYVSSFEPGYIVTQVDKTGTHVWVKKEGSDRVQCKDISEVTKIFN
jgi:hypothetical protein